MRLLASQIFGTFNVKAMCALLRPFYKPQIARPTSVVDSTGVIHSSAEAKQKCFVDSTPQCFAFTTQVQVGCGVSNLGYQTGIKLSLML